MKFGKLPTIDNISFSFPSDPEANKIILAGLNTDNLPPAFYIGCTGWSMKEWVGRVYPSKTATKDYLYHYSRQFNTIELNSTHYTIPKKEVVQQWCRQSPDDFRFCPKVLQTISHSNSLGFGTPLLTNWLEAINCFETRLGCCFIQLPPYFGIKDLKVLEQWLQRLPKGFPLAVEMRHESIFEKTSHLDEWINLLKTYAISTVITDVAGRRDVLHLRLSNEKVVIRFVGNGLHSTDFQRIDNWIERIRYWFDAGLKEVYFFAHEPDNLLAPDLADYIFKQARIVMPEVTMRGPTLIDPDQQLKLF